MHIDTDDILLLSFGPTSESKAELETISIFQTWSSCSSISKICVSFSSIDGTHRSILSPHFF